MIPRTRCGRAIRARWISATGRTCVLVESPRDGRVEGYYEANDGTCGDLIDLRALERYAALAGDRMRKLRYLLDLAVQERVAFRAAHPDIEVEPEVQELGLRFTDALARFEREAGRGQPYAERYTR